MILFGLTILALIVIVIAMFVIAKINFFNKDVYRFILTGGFNTFNYYLMFLILFGFANIEYIIAHICAFLYSAFCSFFMTTMYTFNERPTMRTFIKFPLTFLPNLVISTLGTIVFVNTGLLDAKYASIVAMFAAIPITFVVSKIIVTGNIKNEKA